MSETASPHKTESSHAKILLVGTPNAGKSTLFNRLTGARAKTSNLQGTTVSIQRATGKLPSSRSVTFVDLPGTASLAAQSPDEVVTMRAVLEAAHGADPSVLLVVLDTPRLARSLYLALQTLELGRPVVIALNLIDEAREAGREPDARALSDLLGVPVIAISSRTGEGVDALVQVLDGAFEHPVAGTDLVPWPFEVERAVGELREVFLPLVGADRPVLAEAFSRWALLSEANAVDLIDKKHHASIAACLEQILERDPAIPDAIVAARYAWIDARLDSLASRAQEDVVSQRTDRLDAILLHPLWGSLVFLGVMWVVFEALFAWADPLVSLIEDGFGWLGAVFEAHFDTVIAQVPQMSGPLEFFRDLLVGGIIAGVGAVVVFIPQIALLFAMIAFLEDIGYMPRAAALMDRLLRAAGLPGKAFVPLLSGFACAVPAIMATRTMPRFRDRLLTMLVIPWTTCSARLPVYTLLVAALFPATIAHWPIPVRPTALLVMYVLSAVLTLFAAVVLGKFVLPAQAEASVLELPPYRRPSPLVIWRRVVSKTSAFLREAGRIILVASVMIWAMLTYPKHAVEHIVPPDVLAQAVADHADLDDVAAPYRLEASVAGKLGHALEPITAPLGFDWRIDIGLIGAFAAREVFVSTLGVVYGIEDADETSAPLRDKLREAQKADGSPRYTVRSGMSIMVFFMLAMQCMSTLAVMRRESGGWKWPAFATFYMTGSAYLASLLVYQTLGWFGWP